MILLPLSLFNVIFFPTALIFPYPLHSLILFSNRLDKLPPIIHPYLVEVYFIAGLDDLLGLVEVGPDRLLTYASRLLNIPGEHRGYTVHCTLIQY